MAIPTDARRGRTTLAAILIPISTRGGRTRPAPTDPAHSRGRRRRRSMTARPPIPDPYGARTALGPGLPDVYRLAAVADRIDLAALPITVKILLENLLRHAGGGVVRSEDVETLLAWRPG